MRPWLLSPSNRIEAEGSALLEFVVVVVVLLVPIALALAVLLRVHLVQAELREVTAAAALAVARDGGGSMTARRVVADLWSESRVPTVAVRCRSACGSATAAWEVRLATEVDLSPLPGRIEVAYAHTHVRDRFGAWRHG